MLVTFTNRHGGVSQGVYSTLNLGDHVGDIAADVLIKKTNELAI
jgi:copper oxidase (laccase) domain-containing protein